MVSSAWNKLVKRVYHDNKHKSGYMFKHALTDASKLHKSTPGKKSASKRGGRKKRGGKRTAKRSRRHKK